MVAFERSLAMGVAYLETDVRVTRDGRAVTFHDASLSRVTGRSGLVRDHTLAQLSGIHVGGREPIPALDDVLGSLPEARFMIDVKDRGAVGPTIRAIARTGSAHRVCLAGAWDGWLRLFPEAFGPGQVATALGWRALSTLIGCARTGVRPPARVATGGFAHVAWQLSGRELLAHPRVGERLIGMAHDLGIRVMTWTVNATAEMHRVLDLGVDGVITDRPDSLLDVFAARRP